MTSGDWLSRYPWMTSATIAIATAPSATPPYADIVRQGSCAGRVSDRESFRLAISAAVTSCLLRLADEVRLGLQRSTGGDSRRRAPGRLPRARRRLSPPVDLWSPRRTSSASRRRHDVTAAEIASRKDSRSLTRPAHEPWRTMSAYGGVALGAVAMAIVALVIHGYRLSQSPDVIVDETVYYLVAHSVQVGTGLAFHPLPGNNPFFLQPPLFFVVEAGWLSNFGSSGGDLFHALYAARFLNVVIAALTAAGIVVLGSRLWDAKAGVLMSALYVLDPFIQRGTRLNMLEPLAGLFVLVTVLLILRYVDVRRRGWLIAAGVSAGLALLSKEIAFFVLAVPFGLAVFERFRTWLLN